MHPAISAVIPAQNEERTIAGVIGSVRQLGSSVQIVVVVNGSTDRTADIARSMNAEVYECEEPLGYDAGRLYGAGKAKGDAILFLDADFAVSAGVLQPFVTAVLKDGVDLALNRQPVAIRSDSYPTIVFKYMLNRVLRRSDLSASSMTAVPHALSRRALDALRCGELSIPPLAQAKLAEAAFRVRRVAHVPVSRMNRKRSRASKQFVTDLILGDHLEAIWHVLERRGSRGGFTDLGRRRQLLADRAAEAGRTNRGENAQGGVTAIIPAGNEQTTIARVVAAAMQAGADRAVVVVNGSSDDTEAIARQLGAEVLCYSERLGHDIGRAIGAAHRGADVYLFLDADIVVSPEEIRPFIAAVRQQGVDVALNDLNGLLKSYKSVHCVTYAARLLNTALRRPDLGANSMTAVPHALSRRAVEMIGYEALGVPALAMVKAVQSGSLHIRPAAEVDVITRNSTDSDPAQTARMILGDTFEAIHAILQTAGNPRGDFRGGETRVWEERG